MAESNGDRFSVETIVKAARGAPMLGALGLGLATAALAIFAPPRAALELFAVIMAAIGAVYFGFAIKDAKAAGIEVLVSIGFVLVGLLGLWVSPWFVAAGLFAHGFWDLLHHRERRGLVSVPLCYIPFCVMYDWLGAAIVAVWIVVVR